MKAESDLGHIADPSRAYDHAPCGLLTMTRTGGILQANETFRRWLDLNQDESLPSFLGLLRPGDRIFWETHLAPLLDMQGRVDEIAVELTTPIGSLPALLNATVENPGDPQSTIDVAVFRATDRRSYEQELLAERKSAEEAESTARELAQTLQQSLIPPIIPGVPGLEISASYRPAGNGTEIGGDWYDVFQLDTSSWMITIGDVCGKGASAAALTAFVRYTIRGASMETDNIAKILGGVNNALMMERTNNIATVALLRIDLADRSPKLDVSSAGHPLPKMIKPDGTVHKIGRPGTLLGGFPETTHHVERIELNPGETIVLFTDGVTEGRSDEDFFGEDRLDAFLRLTPVSDIQEIATGLAQHCVAFQNGTPRDDIAVVALRPTIKT